MAHIKVTTFSAGEISITITSGDYEYNMHAYLKNKIAYAQCFVDMQTTARYKEFCKFDAWDLLNFMINVLMTEEEYVELCCCEFRDVTSKLAIHARSLIGKDLFDKNWVDA
jgi:hypothetical protein